MKEAMKKDNQSDLIADLAARAASGNANARYQTGMQSLKAQEDYFLKLVEEKKTELRENTDGCS